MIELFKMRYDSLKPNTKLVTRLANIISYNYLIILLIAGLVLEVQSLFIDPLDSK